MLNIIYNLKYFLTLEFSTEYKEDINKEKDKESKITEDKNGEGKQENGNKTTGNAAVLPDKLCEVACLPKTVKKEERGKKDLAREVEQSCKEMLVMASSNSETSHLKTESCGCAKSSKLGNNSENNNSVIQSSTRQDSQPKHDLIHYESKPQTFETCSDNGETGPSKPVMPEKSTNLLKKFFRSISNDQSKGSKNLDDHRTVYKRSHSATLPNSMRIISKPKSKKSHSFRMRRPNIFKGKKSSRRRNSVEDCQQRTFLDTQSSLNNDIPSSVSLTSEPSCGEERQLDPCAQLADQACNDPVYHVDSQDAETAEKLPKELCEPLRTAAAESKDTCSNDKKCISRPVSSSSEESVQSPPTTPDSGFCSSEGTKNLNKYRIIMWSVLSLLNIIFCMNFFSNACAQGLHSHILM